jgi:acyl-CoA thioesterase-1
MPDRGMPQRPSSERNRAPGARSAASPRGAAARPPGSLVRWRIVAALVVLALIAAWLWRSPLRNVKNLDSRGTAIVAFGDSLTAGYGAAPGDDYPTRLGSLVGLPIVNAGVSGDTTASAMLRLDDDVFARDPRIVIVGLGGNDYLQRVDIAVTEANLRTIVRRIQGRGAMVVLLGFRFPTLGPSYDDLYQRVADDESCLLVGNLLRGILNDASMKSDEVHPNARGYALMAERIAGPLRALLKKAGRR